MSANQRCPPFRVSVNWREYCIILRFLRYQYSDDVHWNLWRIIQLLKKSFVIFLGFLKMIKLLVIPFMIKLYAQNNIFKYLDSFMYFQKTKMILIVKFKLIKYRDILIIIYNNQVFLANAIFEINSPLQVQTNESCNLQTQSFVFGCMCRNRQIKTLFC